MFPFFKRRDEGPIAVEDAVFTSEEIFVLLGESLDIGCFAAQPRNLNLGYYKAEGASAWRKRLVSRFEEKGLVDDAGRPTPDLLRALEPLLGKGLYIGDGDRPGPEDPVERRTAVLCLTPDLSRATAVVKDGRGFRLRPFPDDPSLWEAEFLRLYNLTGLFCWAERSQSYLGGGLNLEDSSFSNALKGGTGAVREWCRQRGISEAFSWRRCPKSATAGWELEGRFHLPLSI